jgi:hypothetical protein
MEFKQYWAQCIGDADKEAKNEKFHHWEILTDGFMNNLPSF